jgi:hypothetical protein
MASRMSPEMVAEFEQPQLTGAVREDSTDLRGWVLAPRVVENPTVALSSGELDDKPAPTQEPGGVTVATSETYRARRISQLMRRAADAERARSQQHAQPSPVVKAQAADDDLN